MKARKRVFIYRNHLFRPSETFIQSQTENFSNFEPIFVGLKANTKYNNKYIENVLTVSEHKPYSRIESLRYQVSSRHSTFFRELAGRKVNLIHAHFGPDGVKAIPLAKSLAVPLVVTFHGYDVTVNTAKVWHSSYSYLMYTLKRKKLKQTASKFIAVSKFIKEKLLQKGFPSELIDVHYIGVDTKHFTYSREVKREPIVLFVGRLVEVKGCKFLIEAMRKVQSLVPNSQLIIIGDGPLRKTLERLASKLIRNYQFLGFQPSSVVKDWMSRAKVFCVPSVTTESGYTEAFGIAFLEAQASGLPVVSSLSGGIPEAVEHQFTGFLAPEKNCDAIAGYILKLLRDETLWQKMSFDAAKRTKMLFDIRNQTKELEEIYLKILSL